MCQKYTVVSIKEITKDDRKLTRPCLETAQVEDAAISFELHRHAEVAVLKGHQQHHGEENAEQLRCKYTALLRVM